MRACSWLSFVPFVMRAVSSRGTLIGLLLSLVAGCITLTTPRENFINFRNTEIGRHIDQIEDLSDLVKLRRLPNGNIERTYDASIPRGPCIYVREIDQQTGRGVAWRTEGDDRGCGIAP